jgi:hypothetical protein
VSERGLALTKLRQLVFYGDWSFLFTIWPDWSRWRRLTIRIHQAFVSASSQSAAAKDVPDEYFECYGVAPGETD